VRRADRGSATVEFAVVLPALALILAAVLVLGSASVTQFRCADGARAGARSVALGEADGVASASAARVAGPGATVRVVHDAPWVTVTVRRAVAGSWLARAGLAAEASATAWVEP